MTSYGKSDIETGPSGKLYPTMTESPELRWGFIRKVYAIVTVQLLLTVAVGALVVKFHPIVKFFTATTGGLVCYVILLIIPFIMLFLLFCFHDSHPLNYVLLAIFTISFAVAIGLACSFTHGKVILEAAILTTVIAVSLTLFTFWGAKRGHDFSFLGPFLFAALNMLIVFGLIQIFFPMGKITHMIYGGISALVFCGFIVYDTFNLIELYTYDDYILAAIALYLDVLNLFLALLTIFSNGDT
ncbi:bax inhibitor-1 family protein [Artemisia annua]|uniref:Bax inhibitor-1 family protein n=1 Tax=Artemisia annua TaxID=35608 RepID=A0A2U1QFH7_ARTAN|nr:bax inhibitor-1 family protein [Artemisia annua]